MVGEYKFVKWDSFPFLFVGKRIPKTFGVIAMKPRKIAFDGSKVCTTGHPRIS